MFAIEFMPDFQFFSLSGSWQGVFRKISSSSMMGVTSAFFFLLIVLTAVAPPGLCACWLIPEVESVHPHVSKAHAESHHTHDYLLQISQTTGTDILPLMILPAHVLIALAFAGLIWWALRGDEVSEAGWVPVIPMEPPERACQPPRRFMTNSYAYNCYFSSSNGVLHGSLKYS